MVNLIKLKGSFMAKSAKSKAKTKASPAPKKAKESKLATTTDDVINDPAAPATTEAAPAPIEKAGAVKKASKSELILKLSTLFKEAKETLASISDTKKQPRQLRFAIQQIDLAERAAGRAINHVA